MIELEHYYQPVPYPEYPNDSGSVKRLDCCERYTAIKECYGEFKGKSLIDIACSNGYFCIRFLQDGGANAVGVDIDEATIKFNNELAKEKKLNFETLNRRLPLEMFDIGIYLDTHFAPGTESYPQYLSENIKVCFTSSAENNEKYHELLKKYFKKITQIYKGYAERIIYRCE